MNTIVPFLKGIRWKSIDRDNMEFRATITYSQMDRWNEIIAALEQDQDSPPARSCQTESQDHQSDFAPFLQPSE